MKTPPKGKRRDDNKELKVKFAQKKGLTKAQKRLKARRDDFDVNRLATTPGKTKFHRPGSLK